SPRPTPARHRLGLFEGQYFGAGGCSLSAGRRITADPGFRHFQYGNQYRSGRRTFALRCARTGLWLALRLRHRRDLYAPWPCHLSLRIPLPASASGAAQVRGHSAHGRREPDDLAKIGIGAWITAASNFILVAAIIASGGAPVHPIWPFLYSTGLGISFLYYWPTLLALVSRAAPAKVNATLMGLAFMSL